MMDKRIIIGILGMFLLLATLVISAEVFGTDRNRDITAKQLELARARGIDSYNYEDYKDYDSFKRCLKSESNFRLPCSKEFTSYEMICNLWTEEIKLIDKPDEIDELGKVTTYPDQVIIINNFTDFANSMVNLYSKEEIYQVSTSCLSDSRVNFTDAEIETRLNSWEEETLDMILDSEEKREVVRSGSLIREGNVSLKIGK